MIPRAWLRLWFTFERTVGRREYLLTGLALGALKYTGDALLVYQATGRWWRITDYLSPVSSLASAKLDGASPVLLPLLALWSLPFLWIGISMSIRRSLDADFGPWFALLFFVPGVNYAFMALMCAVPSRASDPLASEPPRAEEPWLPRALLAIATGAGVGLGLVAISVYLIESYGAALFFGTPFFIGALTSYLFNTRYPASERESHQVVFMTFGCIGGVLLLTAAEGALCLAMAAPIGLAVGAMGASLGRKMAMRASARVRDAWVGLLAVPLGAGIGAGAPPMPLREVRSSVVVDAPPSVVWENVVAFPPLPPPSELVFRAGIAYPMRAEIRGTGVGAVRYCVFSTGAFVEPITVWEPGRRLAFDVDSQPRPLEEWSPWADVAPPHLDGWFTSRRGEFRLVALPGGRTRLEGSTWYQMRLEPAAYWVLFGDLLVGRIHDRVLEHVKRTAEAVE